MKQYPLPSLHKTLWVPQHDLPHSEQQSNEHFEWQTKPPLHDLNQYRHERQLKASIGQPHWILWWEKPWVVPLISKILIGPKHDNNRCSMKHVSLLNLIPLPKRAQSMISRNDWNGSPTFTTIWRDPMTKLESKFTQSLQKDRQQLTKGWGSWKVSLPHKSNLNGQMKVRPTLRRDTQNPL